MKKLYNKIYLILGLTIGISSCSDVLEEVPKSLISPENFYQSEGDALATLYSAYDALGSGNGVYYRWYRDMTLYLADEGYSTKATMFWPLNTYLYDSRDFIINQFWQFSYDAINRANAVIDNVPEMDMDQSKIDAIVGEAKFIRALNYFNLVRLFGEVPLKLKETNSLENTTPEVASMDDVYAQIIEDVKFAEENLPILVRGSSDAIGRADMAAAKMLLAKVYIMMTGYPINDTSKWTLALQKSKELYDMRDQFGFGLWDNYLDVFEPTNENGKEDILSIQFQAGLGAPFAGEGSLQHIDNFKAVAGRRGNWLNRVSVKLKQMYEDNDERNLALPNYQMVAGKKYNMGNNNYMFYKYVEQNVVDDNLPANDTEKNFPLYRYADLLLMCSEAENEVNGPTAFAYECLNAVRFRSEASEISGLSQDEFREFILDERMRELSNEGHRFFDLKRTQKLIEEVQECHDLDPTWKPNVPTEKNYWLPYPADELNYNPNIQQRDGY